MPSELIPLVILSPILLATGYCDLRRMRIPNALSLLAVGLFLVSAPFLLTGEEAAMRGLVAGAALLVGFVMFAFGLLGGGDVKIFAALVLFVPTPSFSLFLLLFSAAMIFGMALMPVLRALPGATSLGWVSLRPDARFPMGISIALSGLAHPVLVAALN
jgi:prepilin peptidase CpaA